MNPKIESQSPQLRAAVNDATWELLDVMARGEGITPVRCERARDLFAQPLPSGSVAILDWAKSDGLLSQEQHSVFRRLADLLPVVILVPQGWLRMLNADTVGVAIVRAKPLLPSEITEILREVSGSAPLQVS
jgi:hypothetical protein